MAEVETKPPAARNPVSRRVVVLLFVLAGLVWLRDPVEFRIRLHKQLTANVPDDAYIDAVFDLPPGQFSAAVHALWASPKIAHRQAAMRLLSLKAALNQVEQLPPFRPLLVEALVDCDSGLRENALNLLVRIDGAEAAPHLLTHLQDGDNHIRTIAMWHLRHLRVTNALPHIAAQLRDPDPLLAYESVQWLQRVTGIHHGMRSEWMTRNSELAADRTAGHNNFQLARQSATTWWARVGQQYPVVPLPALRPTRRSAPLDLASYDLIRSDRSPLNCVVLEKRPLLLYFFTSWNTFGMFGADQVREVAGDQLPVLAVSLDTIMDAHNLSNLEQELGPRGAHSDPLIEGTIPYPLSQITAMVDETLRHIGFKLPVVHDLQGRLTRTLQAGEIPAYVLLDADHRIVRRFSGTRSGETLVRTAIQAGLITNPNVMVPSSTNAGGSAGVR